MSRWQGQEKGDSMNATHKPIQAQYQALNAAISKGVIIQANIKGTMRKLISIKSEPTTGVTMLFHDEQKNLCMFRVTPGQEIELLVKVGSEAAK